MSVCIKSLSSIRGYYLFKFDSRGRRDSIDAGVALDFPQYFCMAPSCRFLAVFLAFRWALGFLKSPPSTIGATICVGSTLCLLIPSQRLVPICNHAVGLCCYIKSKAMMPWYKKRYESPGVDL